MKNQARLLKLSMKRLSWRNLLKRMIKMILLNEVGKRDKQLLSLKMRTLTSKHQLKKQNNNLKNKKQVNSRNKFVDQENENSMKSHNLRMNQNKKTTRKLHKLRTLEYLLI